MQMYKNTWLKEHMDASIEKCASLAGNTSLVKCGAVMSGAMANIIRDLKDLEKRAVNLREFFEKMFIDRYI